MSRSWLVHFAFTFAMTLGFSQPSQAQKEPESYIAVIGRPGVVGAPVQSPGGEGAVVKGSPKLGETEPIRMKGKETISVPDQGVVSLLVFSRQHDAGKTAQGSINLKPGTKATVDPAAIDKDDDVLLDLEKGSAQVTKEPKSKGVFRVRTPQATMAVRGTELWLKHEPAAGGKPVNTLCVVPTGTVEATVGDKKIRISAGYILEIEDGKAKPLVKIKADVLRSFADFRYEPIPGKWLIVDCEDANKPKEDYGKIFNYQSSIRYFSQSLFVDEADSYKYLPLMNKRPFQIMTQSVNVSAYRYAAVLVRFLEPSDLTIRIYGHNYSNAVSPTPTEWFNGTVKSPRKNKWEWFIYNIDEGTTSKNRLVGGLGFNTTLNEFNAVHIRQVLFLRELPSSMKDRVYQDKKPSP